MITMPLPKNGIARYSSNYHMKKGSISSFNTEEFKPHSLPGMDSENQSELLVL